MHSPHLDEAYASIDFTQRPDVAAANTAFNKLANGNLVSLTLMAADVRSNEAIYPLPATMERLFTYGVITPDYDRLLNRSWTRFRTGR